MSNTCVLTGRGEKYLFLFIRYFFGAHTLVSGVNYFLVNHFGIHWLPDRSPTSPELAARFIGVLIDSHMYDFVKLVEIFTGLCLMAGIWMPVALILEMPVTVIVLYLSLFIAPTPHSLYTGPRELFFNLFMLSAYWGYFKPFVCSLNPPLKPLWHAPIFTSAKGDAS